MSAGTLEQRVSNLEQLVAGLQGSEALQPNYLTVSPTGQVGADFTGIINALGLIIPAAQVGAPASTNKIVWERTSDGAVAASIGTSLDFGGGIIHPSSQLLMDLEQPGTTNDANVALSSNVLAASASVTATDGTDVAALTTKTGSGQASVTATADANLINIIDQAGNSSFAQNTTINGASSTGFTSGTMTAGVQNYCPLNTSYGGGGISLSNWSSLGGTTGIGASGALWTCPKTGIYIVSQSLQIVNSGAGTVTGSLGLYDTTTAATIANFWTTTLPSGAYCLQAGAVFAYLTAGHVYTISYVPVFGGAGPVWNLAFAIASAVFWEIA